MMVSHDVTCPGCGTVTTYELPSSVNPERSPDDARAIERGWYRRYRCVRCGAGYTVDTPFLYIDLPSRFVAGHFPLGWEDDWPAHERVLRDTVARNFGAAAPTVARELGQGLTCRAVFGLAALREKVLCQRAGLDDRVLEALKLSLVAGDGRLPLDPATRPRLVSADAATLGFGAELEHGAGGEAEMASLTVDRAAYRAIADDPDPWREVLAHFDDALYVDLGRVLLGSPEAAD
jgi:hypothetical protein